VSKILATLLNDNKGLFTAGINGDASELCKLMVLSNKSSPIQIQLSLSVDERVFNEKTNQI